MKDKLKVWYPPELFDAKNRNGWFELIKSQERNGRKYSPQDQAIQDRLEWVDNKKNADFYILPMLWNVYYSQGREDKAIAFCKEADAAGKTIFSTSGGDQGISVPVPNSTIVYRQSGYRSKRKANERTSPFFLSDPVTQQKRYSEEELFKYDQTNQPPIVGFCGMAPHGIKTYLKETIRIVYRNAQSLIGRTADDQQVVLSSSNLRYETLQAFEQSTNFNTNYLIREKYRGGAQTAQNRQKTTIEYYQNQLESDLMVCVRGVGNFSLRFYESLAMGRIPIFIDTDSPLPDISPLDWNDYIIKVDYREIRNAPEKAKSWLAKRNLHEQKKKSRQLWVDRFRGDSFWIRELDKINACQ